MNHRFEAIRANRLHVMKIGYFLRIDSRELCRFALRIAGPSKKAIIGRLSKAIPQGVCTAMRARFRYVEHGPTELHIWLSGESVPANQDAFDHDKGQDLQFQDSVSTVFFFQVIFFFLFRFFRVIL